MDKEKDKKGKTNWGDSNKRKVVSFMSVSQRRSAQKQSTVFCARNMGASTALTI